MKIGLNMQITDTTPHPMDIARKCEAWGFESMFVNEHVLVPVNCKTPYYFGRPGDPIPEYYAHFPEPFIALAMAAAVTKNIKIGTCVSLVAEHEPIALAKAIATLDFLAGGRFVFGVGGGWLRHEAEIMGVDFPRRWRMVVEYLRAMKEIWTNEEASFEGEFVSFPPVKCYPKPASKPHPPIHIGAGDHKGPCDRALRNTVAVADGWMPTLMSPQRLATELATLQRMCLEAGRNFRSLEISIALGWQYTKAQARTLIKEYGAIGVHRIIPTLGGTAFDEDPDIIDKVADAFLG
ncbi:MAG TPA: TIGR03619 family F420-dependent LLM class oxidoreductase [Candidatus Binataceae bacterium]|nr:TIGR03619 family F420-dependent LLM class oxidoreductase [Candidatus Binataceae bacterium]